MGWTKPGSEWAGLDLTIQACTQMWSVENAHVTRTQTLNMSLIFRKMCQ